ncbi:hypothetical protein C3F09_02965 [candidate division GN15 bacterium]|uniref:Tetratricopeptide repeat protein n=1 Tax=candidate division GN15 bacterium TaxID=2072418 RepID=A0A855XB60_9BACT|nr:MAG: hypothetical protein C3F09_02965 [candidate division GN15 bacterium]
MIMLPELPNDNPPEVYRTRSDWKLVAPFAFVVALQVIGTFVNDNNVWGVNLWSIFPVWAIVAVTAVYVLVSVPSVSLRLYQHGEPVVALIFDISKRWPKGVKWTLVTLLFAVLAWLLRSRALIYGDGFVVVSISDRPFANAFVTLHDYYRPLTILIQQSSQMLRYLGLDDKETIFWTMRVIEGVIGWLGLLRLVRSATDESVSRAIMFLTALTSGCVVLLLGWVELYVLPTALLLWLLASAVRYVKHTGSFWPIGIFGLLAMASSAVIAPVTIMVVLLSLKLHGDVPLARWIPRPRVLLLLVVLLAIGAGVAFNLLTEVNFVVPLVATSINPYWTLSPRHLADLINLMLFVSPVLIAFLVMTFLNRADRRWMKEPTAILIGLAGFTCMLVTFWLNPVLGAPCDWDLLSFFGFPMTLLAGYALSKMVTDARQRRLLTVQLMLVAAILLVPNVYDKTHLDTAVRRIEPLAWNDIHYQPSYYQAHRCISFGSLLLQNCGEDRLAEKYFRRRIQAKPDDELGWYNLGVLFFKRQQYRQAADCFERAVELKPSSVEYRKSLQAASVEAMHHPGQ